MSEAQRAWPDGWRERRDEILQAFWTERARWPVADLNGDAFAMQAAFRKAQDHQAEADRLHDQPPSHAWYRLGTIAEDMVRP